MEVLSAILITVGVIVGLLIVGAIVIIAVGLNAYYHSELGQTSLEQVKAKRKK